ncbi:MAG: hypothetical protein M3415_03800 [Actinomycetota bacterium]|jgi:hypothetical protein|nr:hypothetical protein [Actinomycetota bacterium]
METRPGKAAMLAAAVGATLLFGATAAAAGQPDPSPTPGLGGMSESTMPGEAGMMAHMHERMLERHPGMQRMHERAMSGDAMGMSGDGMMGMSGGDGTEAPAP